jgi:hypothetical protein
LAFICFSSAVSSGGGDSSRISYTHARTDASQDEHDQMSVFKQVI